VEVTSAARPEAATARIALVGDRSPAVRAHVRIPGILRGLEASGEAPLEACWLHSTAIREPDDVAGFDGVWAMPGSPYESAEGVLAAVLGARELRIPFLGTCGGFQHALLELARDVCGLRGVEHAETAPDAPELLIVPLACSLAGAEGDVEVAAGTRAAEAIGEGRRRERYLCSYGLHPAYLATLERHGLVVSGRDGEGEVRVVELPEHPFFLATLYQPELSSDEHVVHPLLRAFAAAARLHAAAAALR
jgi:CTP synthase (UTP-ammonia lyase)